MCINELKKLSALRTQGAWEHRYGDSGQGVYFGPYEHQRIAVDISGSGNGGAEESRCNAALIASAVNNLDTLLKVAHAAASYAAYTPPTDMVSTRAFLRLKDALNELGLGTGGIA